MKTLVSFFAVGCLGIMGFYFVKNNIIGVVFWGVLAIFNYLTYIQIYLGEKK